MGLCLVFVCIPFPIYPTTPPARALWRQRRRWPSRCGRPRPLGGRPRAPQRLHLQSLTHKDCICNLCGNVQKLEGFDHFFSKIACNLWRTKIANAIFANHYYCNCNNNIHYYCKWILLIDCLLSEVHEHDFSTQGGAIRNICIYIYICMAWISVIMYIYIYICMAWI